jgi:prepilin-type N-terminal cleavage/methylation domain-containing protein
MKPFARRIGQAAFTLIELMVVITIIIILAGLVVGGMEYANQRSASEKAKTQIALLSKGIEEYKLDMGAYPGTDDNTTIAGDVSEQLYETLFYEGYDYDKQSYPAVWEKTVNGVKIPKAIKIYLSELNPLSTKQGWVTTTTSGAPAASLKILDPWGNNYRYRKGTTAQNPDFDLWSMGKDGKSNTANPSTTDSLNADDIRNF